MFKGINHLLFLLFLISSFFMGCKKKQTETSITGIISSKIENASLSNVQVEFYVNSLSGNSYSSVFQLKESINTSFSGAYNFSFIKTSSDVEYKIEFIKEGYLFKSILFSPNAISTGEENIRDVSLVPIGEVTFNIKSISNTSNTDELLFTFNNELESGQSFSNLLFTGGSVDSTFSTITVAEKFNLFNYVIRRNGQFYSVLDSVFVSKNNSVTTEVVY
jgi:hypothetical protein